MSYFLISIAVCRKVEGFEWLSTAHYDPVEDIIYGPNHKYNFALNTSTLHYFFFPFHFFNFSVVGNGTEWSLYSSTLDILTHPWDPRGNPFVAAGSARIYHFGGVCFKFPIAPD